MGEGSRGHDTESGMRIQDNREEEPCPAPGEDAPGPVSRPSHIVALITTQHGKFRYHSSRRKQPKVVTVKIKAPLSQLSPSMVTCSGNPDTHEA